MATIGLHVPALRTCCFSTQMITTCALHVAGILACTADGSLAIGADPARMPYKEHAVGQASSSRTTQNPTPEDSAAALAALEGNNMLIQCWQHPQPPCCCSVSWNTVCMITIRRKYQQLRHPGAALAYLSECAQRCPVHAR